ncbi:Lrp/AsnC family transcriptional regulator [Cellulosimicrobium terreum]|uniref:Lrp/AsnC family transcriptional regulator n=1 Tax=Cellulosimicrobium funkei TaxID=264251 RepID=A0A4Y8R3W9_9MICO|nr:Lrp/AsnC family transcriptional regulator [Cellulosimicrobium aquatile]TFF12462.1 Lrp/AsnC family transcriptional regulator [Cellulosimicrobium funkei]TGA77419.1 Lrp/AsnC family transcriptional regulator [Cellulosimicrobium terreum]
MVPHDSQRGGSFGVRQDVPKDHRPGLLPPPRRSPADQGRPTVPKDLRPSALDDVDRRILDVLATDARATNAAVAARVGIAASTCHARVRALVDRGVIRGFRADVDPAALGRGLEALIAIRLQAGARKGLEAFRDYLLTLPDVEGVFFVTGDRDFLLHVAVADSDALRDLVSRTLSVRPEVAGTSTTVIFEHARP